MVLEEGVMKTVSSLFLLVRIHIAITTVVWDHVFEPAGPHLLCGEVPSLIPSFSVQTGLSLLH